MIQEACSLWQFVVDVDVNDLSLDRAAAWAGAVGARARARGAARGPRAVGSAFRLLGAGPCTGPTGAGRRPAPRGGSFHCEQAAPPHPSLLAARAEYIRIRTARASVLASVGLCSSSTGRSGPVVRSMPGSARRPRCTHVLTSRAGWRDCSRQPLHATCAAVYLRALRAAAGRSLAPTLEATAVWCSRVPARGEVHAGPGECRDGPPILADSVRDLARRTRRTFGPRPASSATKENTRPAGPRLREAAPRHHPGEVAAAFFQPSSTSTGRRSHVTAVDRGVVRVRPRLLAVASGGGRRGPLPPPILARCSRGERNVCRGASIVEAKLAGRPPARPIRRSRDARASWSASSQLISTAGRARLGSLGAALLAQARATRPGTCSAPPRPRAEHRCSMMSAACSVMCRRACVLGVLDHFPRGSRGPGWRETSCRRPRRGSRASCPARGGGVASTVCGRQRTPEGRLCLRGTS